MSAQDVEEVPRGVPRGRGSHTTTNAGCLCSPIHYPYDLSMITLILQVKVTHVL